MVRRWSAKSMAQSSPLHNYREQAAGVRVPSPLLRKESALRVKGSRSSRARVHYGDEPRVSPALSLASLSALDPAECETVLSQYMTRIQRLEREVGQVLVSKGPREDPSS